MEFAIKSEESFAFMFRRGFPLRALCEPTSQRFHHLLVSVGLFQPIQRPLGVCPVLSTPALWSTNAAEPTHVKKSLVALAAIPSLEIFHGQRF